jgi:hypothetical protein
MHKELHASCINAPFLSGALSKRSFINLLVLAGFIILGFLPITAIGQYDEYRYSHLFSAAECIEDWNFYKNKLEEIHPNLYLYTSQPEMRQFFDSISASIMVPMNSINFFNLITVTHSKIKDGHTHIFPDPATTEANDLHAAFFPIKVHWEDGRMYVVKVYSSDKQLSPGTEIQIINGVNAGFLYNLMMRRQIRDGYNSTYPAWLLEQYFAEYYSYHLGNPDAFILHTRKPDNTFETYTIKALSKDSIAYYKKSKYGELRGEGLFHTGITIAIDTSRHTALLTIKDFHNDILRTTYHQKFKDVITDCFSQIHATHVEHLILDLRNNQGGDIENGITLLSNLLDTSFKVVESYSVVDMKTYQIPMARLKSVSGSALGMHEPLPRTYTGKLYVLINGGSFSNSAIVCSALRRYNRCLFIGEETGGNPYVFAAGGNYINLPNTKTKVLVPNLQYKLRSSVPYSTTGLQPDYPIIPTLDDIQAGRDPVLLYTYHLIKETRR